MSRWLPCEGEAEDIYTEEDAEDAEVFLCVQLQRCAARREVSAAALASGATACTEP